jgi:hypothetical protein
MQVCDVRVTPADTLALCTWSRKPSTEGLDSVAQSVAPLIVIVRVALSVPP